jgi:hypothetical protein
LFVYIIETKAQKFAQRTFFSLHDSEEQMDKLSYIVLAQTPAPRRIDKAVVLSQEIKNQIISRVIILGFVVCVS